MGCRPWPVRASAPKPIAWKRAVQPAQLQTNNTLTEVSSWIDRMASRQQMAPTDRRLDLARLLRLFRQRNRIRKNHFLQRAIPRSAPPPDPTAPHAWRRPKRWPRPVRSSASAPFTSVPAVSIRSSTIRQLRPSTSPTTFITSATLGFFAPLIDNRQRRVQPLGERPRPLHAAGIRRNHRQIRHAPAA